MSLKSEAPVRTPVVGSHFKVALLSEVTISSCHALPSVPCLADSCPSEHPRVHGFQPGWRYPVGVSSMYTRTKHKASRVLVFARHAFLELIVIPWKGFVEGYRVESLGYDDIARKTVWGC